MDRERLSHEQKTLTSSTLTTIQIPTGGKIHDLMLRFANSAGADATVAQIKAEINNIKLTIGGNDIINCSPTDLFDLYEMLGYKVGVPAGIAGVLELNIGKLVYEQQREQELFGFGTANVQSIQVTVTSGTLSAISTVQGYSTRIPVLENLGTYCSFITYPQSFNATGDHTVDTLPRNPNVGYLAALVQAGASGVISFGEVRVQNRAIREKSPPSINALFLSSQKYTQKSGYYAHFFATGSLEDRLKMVGISDLRFVTSFTTAPGAGGYKINLLHVNNLVLPSDKK